jgi:hypothetical protein
MDRFKLAVVLIFCISRGILSINVIEGTKKELENRNGGSHDSLADHNDFHCDLNLMPSQKQMMYLDFRLQAKDIAYDSYKWPKNHEGLVVVPYRISKTSLFSKS